jgi:hypothetical protein
MKKRKGMKVMIASADKKKVLGEGTYIGSERITFAGRRFWTPKFRLGRKIIRGCECWWYPTKKMGVHDKVYHAVGTSSGTPTQYHIWDITNSANY